MKTKLKELHLKRNDKLFINIALIGTIILIIFSVGLRTIVQQNKKEHENQSQLVSQTDSKDSSKESSPSSSEDNSSTTTSSPSSSEETSTESSLSTESSSSSSSEEASTKPSTTSDLSSSEATSKEAATSPIVIDVNDFINKYDNYELDTNQTYQFDAEPYSQEDWGLDADGLEYSIYINDGRPAGFIVFTTEAIAKPIRNSKTVTFTVKIDTSSTTYIDPVRVISATPK